MSAWLVWPAEGRRFDDAAALTDAERARHDRLRDAGRRRLFALSRTAARAVVAAAEGVAIEDAAWSCPAGRPPTAAGFAMSLSHCEDVTVVALGSGPLGVDVERDRPLPAVVSPSTARAWAEAEASFKAGGGAAWSRVVDVPGRGRFAVALAGETVEVDAAAVLTGVGLRGMPVGRGTDASLS